MKKIVFSLLFIALLSSHVQAQLTFQQRTAKDNGIVLYNQYKAISTIEFLEVAAEGGDDEALYYLGEAIRKK